MPNRPGASRLMSLPSRAMSEYLPELALVLALVLVNAVFAGTEIALITLREGQLRRMESG